MAVVTSIDPVLFDLAKHLREEDRAAAMERWREHRFKMHKDACMISLQEAAGYDGQEEDFQSLDDAVERGDLPEANASLSRIYERAAYQYAKAMLAQDERELQEKLEDQAFSNECERRRLGGNHG